MASLRRFSARKSLAFLLFPLLAHLSAVASGAEQAKPSSEHWDAIYFGSARVYLYPAKGHNTAFHRADWEEDKSEAGLTRVLSRAGKQQGVGRDVADIVIPAIPAFDYTYIGQHHGSQGLQAIDEAFATPLIKGPAPTGETGQKVYPAIASGARSALIKRPSGWYRLKGCGNFDRGFEIRENQGGWRGIRGSAFPHTALRELYMTEKLSSLMTRQGAVAANASVGMMLYDEPHLPLGREFQTACVVERTLGDRRFGTHVLAGLELLLPLLVDEDRLNEKRLAQVFPESRPGREQEGLAQIITTSQLITDYSLGTSQFGHDRSVTGLTWSDLPRDKRTMADMIKSEHGLPERAPLGREFPQQWTRAGAKAMDPMWREAWIAAVADFDSALREVAVDGQSLVASGAASSVLAYLFSRTGYDAGRILGAMHSHRISWGTYQDAMCRRDLDEWHCNAHANNLVVIPEASQKGESFLSYLDLDMAFDEASFVDTLNGAAGIDRHDFDRLLWREYVELMEVLAGGDSSTGVPQVARKTVSAQSPKIQAVKSALYDTLVLSYMHGYTGDKKYSTMPYNAKLHKAAHALMRLAIIVMADYVA